VEFSSRRSWADRRKVQEALTFSRHSKGDSAGKTRTSIVTDTHSGFVEPSKALMYRGSWQSLNLRSAATRGLCTANAAD
jgi:hypothetical protein